MPQRLTHPLAGRGTALPRAIALDPQTLAHRAAKTAAHQLLMAAITHPDGSPEQLDCAGAATNIALMLEAYAHLWNAGS